MRQLALAILLLWLPTWAQTGWVPFSPPDKSFKVAFPQAPTLQQEGPPTWLWSAGTSPVYLLGYYQVPEDEEKQGKDFFDAYVALMCRGVGLVEESRTRFVSEGTEGYDIEATNRKGRPAHVHVLHRMPQHRFYFLVMVGDGDPKGYFSSFQVQ